MAKLRLIRDAETRSVGVTVAGETVTLTYYPSRVTPRLFNRERLMPHDELDSPVADVFWAIRFICAVTRDWDLMDEDADGNEVPVPLTPEALADLPAVFIGEVARALMSADQPDPTASETSSTTSSATEPVAPSRTGTRSSGPAGTWASRRGN